MDLRSRLRLLADALPEGGSVAFTRADLVAMLSASGEVGEAANSGELAGTADRTLEQVAAEVKRSASTVRGWCASGALTGAYKLNGRDWRIPAGALRSYLDAQASGEKRSEPQIRTGRAPDLGSWRKHRKVS
ncbi:MAG: helix-turn-helix domain-containing protein [Gemmatimonadota bacterium]|nr:helix-turn-helix domain-containing protein [Gemmatimonadota bacterium]